VFVSQHLGDLQHYEACQAFQETVRDLTTMYEVNSRELLVMHDLHPQYASTAYALSLPTDETRGVQASPSAHRERPGGTRSV
jgi:hydrogenase maturation protein HypF